MLDEALLYHMPALGDVKHGSALPPDDYRDAFILLQTRVQPA